jgi:Protein of unknown function (DUF3307)
MLIDAIVGHLVGDYLVQNDHLALNKKTSSAICAVHCAIWTVCVLFFGWWPWWTAIPLFVAHYIQDRTYIVGWWMDTIGQHEFRTGICSPWSIIVVDNVLHILTLWIIWQWVK